MSKLPTLSDKAIEAWNEHHASVVSSRKRWLRYKAGRVYYIKLVFPHVTVYKIGFTTRTVSHRIETMGLPEGCEAKILQILQCKSGFSAYNLEQALHVAHASKRYRSAKPLIASGYSELYSSDVLGLDRNLKTVVYSRA